MEPLPPLHVRLNLGEPLTTNRPVMTLGDSGSVGTACGLPDARRSAPFPGGLQGGPHRLWRQGSHLLPDWASLPDMFQPPVILILQPFIFWSVRKADCTLDRTQVGKFKSCLKGFFFSWGGGGYECSSDLQFAGLFIKCYSFTSKPHHKQILIHPSIYNARFDLHSGSLETVGAAPKSHRVKLGCPPGQAAS